METQLQPNLGLFGAAYQSQMQALRKPYEVTPLPGKVKKKIATIEHVKDRVLRNGQTRPVYKFGTKEVIVDAGYMVRFPNGHSVRIETKEELERLGFHLDPGLVNMLTGDVMIPNHEKVASQLDLMSLIPASYMPAMTDDEVVTLEEGDSKTVKGGKK